MLGFLNSLYNVRVRPDVKLLRYVEKAKKIVANYFGIPKYLLDDVKVGIANLPTYYEVVRFRIGNYEFNKVRRIGKVLGVYIAGKKRIFLDPENLYRAPRLMKTLIHEFIHNKCSTCKITTIF